MGAKYLLLALLPLLTQGKSSEESQLVLRYQS